MNQFVVQNVTIIDGKRIIPDGFVQVKDKWIVAVGSEWMDNHEECECIDGQGKILMPGLVNTHGHTPMTLLRGISDDLPLERWLKEKIWPAEAALDEETAAAGTALALVEMLRAGTTCFADMYHLNREGTALLTEESGMKASLSRGMIAFGSKEAQREKLNEAVTYAKACDASSSGRLRGAIFPHSPYTCSLHFLQEAKAAADVSSLPFQIHIAETRKEVREYEKEQGKRPIAHLMEKGILSNGSLAVHSVHVNKAEISALSHAGVHVSHNPQSNLKLGSGIAPLPQMLNENIPVSLGTDSAASNNTLDLFVEMRQAAMIHKGNEERAEVTNAQEIVNMATYTGAQTLGFPRAGLIKEGYEADFILIDTRQPHLTPQLNGYGALVYAASGRDVTDVFVAGCALMRDRRLLTLDEEKIRKEAALAHEKWKAAQ
ncbi:5-methylthioadenosine/S-adenosylhomocysteine deaminase [Geomicrobium halophilum]|uniref:5-methylthioadenosine/S-adenosylhomocysteine deaminase n=1 Tax=Geomicrobium halophilum TaxID=549000 RepID=A0A841PPD8_9BACL|nr:amidohydrolase [Geomicrobium halophilum]MBB6449066.1 5-methylthioadenosine/S-adenosylhomocysteine deaminase [Geomicrobium halophilum]